MENTSLSIALAAIKKENQEQAKQMIIDNLVDWRKKSRYGDNARHPDAVVTDVIDDIITNVKF